MDPSKAIKQIEQTISELKESLANKQTNNECYVLFDLRMKALCGVYLNKEDVLNVIDTKHREDIKIEMDSLRQKIINGENQEQNSIVLNSMENFLRYRPVKDKITGYYTYGPKSNYCFYNVKLNDFHNYIIQFQESKTETKF
jgi:hypothetical protein